MGKIKSVGILGGGQLGLLLSQSVARLGGATAVFDPDKDAPLHRHCAQSFAYPFNNSGQLRAFRDLSDVLTYEFEHLPVQLLEALKDSNAQPDFRPNLRALAVAQDRLSEKIYLRDNNFPLADFVELSGANIGQSLREFALPCMVKTVRGGYDGKGQSRLTSEGELDDFLSRELAPNTVLVAERLVDLSKEVSCIVARSKTTEVTMPVIENVHVNSILDTSVYPSSLSAADEKKVQDIALAVARSLEIEGLLTVEFFIDQAGTILINELAPRPHNSGHLTINAFNLSQFDLLARILLDLPIAAPQAVSPGAFAMANIMGDHYSEEGTLDLSIMTAKKSFAGYRDLVLYGKREPRQARKMGHLVTHGGDAQEALDRAKTLRKQLAGGAKLK